MSDSITYDCNTTGEMLKPIRPPTTKNERVFYDCNRLLTMKDINGETPEIFMVSGNRTAGKTYSFKKRLVDRFLKYGEKFCVLVRFKNELNSIEQVFFKDLQEVHFPNIEVSSEWEGALFKKLFINGDECGYCLALNSADSIKKYSSVFVDVNCIFFDEFQSEQGHYCPDEITKFISVHISIARGGGRQSRYVPVYMCSNAVSIINPYYSLFGISKRLTPKTKFLHGDGWVLEIAFNENASKALKTSAFGRAVSGHDYMKYATLNAYLLDSDHFIRKIYGKKDMFVEMVYNGAHYGVWLVDGGEFLYISHSTTPNWPNVITCNVKDHNVSYILQKRSAPYTKALREMYDQGRVFFEDAEIKNAFFDFIGYTLTQ